MNFSGGDTLLYGYVHSDPVNRIDPSGLWDLFGIVEGEVAVILGVDGGAGIVLDTDSPQESGLFATGGLAGGANVGAGIGGGFAVRDVEGTSFNVDINVVKLSFSVAFDDKGFLGVTGTYGPVVGLSSSVTTTDSFTIRDFREQLEEIRRDIEWKTWWLRRLFPWIPESTCELD